MDPHEYSFQFLTETDSTNRVLKERVQQGEVVSGAVAAGRQTAGRGRGSNLWVSPPGGLYLSVALPMEDPEHLRWVGPALSCEVVRWFAGHSVDARIKWPNDWLVQGNKIGGMLSELVRSPRGHLVVVAGIGLNVFVSPELPAAGEVFPKAFTPTCLAHWTDTSGMDIQPMARDLATRLVNAARRIPQDMTAIRKTMNECSATLGQFVVIRLPGGREVAGTAVGFGEDFSLQVENNGLLTRVEAGDCFFASAET